MQVTHPADLNTTCSINYAITSRITGAAGHLTSVMDVTTAAFATPNTGILRYNGYLAWIEIAVVLKSVKIARPLLSRLHCLV